LLLHYGNNIPVLRHTYKSFAVSCWPPWCQSCENRPCHPISFTINRKSPTGLSYLGSGPRTSQDLRDLEEQKLLYEQNPDPAAF